jgi:hypothetical protein
MMSNDDDLCQECDRSATLMILQPDDYIDRFYCYEHAVEWIIEQSTNQRGYDTESAQAALASMINDGVVVEALT